MPKRDPSIHIPMPRVGLLVDEEKVVQQIIQVRQVNGVDSPIAVAIGERVYCPVPGTKPGGEVEPNGFKNDEPSIVFRIEDGSRSTLNMVTTVDVTIFALGGRSDKAAMQGGFADAKPVYRALVHRLGLVENEAVASGTMMGATEVAIGKAETDPGVGNFPTYRSRWRFKLRVNAQE
jgi:hypothetical protein